jgi:site-specific DNA-cytosine methylase
MPRAIDIFCGTGSVSKTLRNMGYDVTSLDILPDIGGFHPTIVSDIMKWDYKKYPPKYFDVIWASPPCQQWSSLSYFNSSGRTKEEAKRIAEKESLPIIRRLEKIIHYFQPRVYAIENPAKGFLSEYLKGYSVVVDYCQYSNWGYKKSTRIWTNNTSFIPRRCHPPRCKNLIPGTNKHRKTYALSRNPKNSLDNWDMGRIPPRLVRDIFS